MNYRLLVGALIFSFGLLTQAVVAMENPDWWGAELEGPPTVKFLTQGDLFTLSIPETTGLSGKVSVPVLSIIDLPNDGEVELKKILPIEANVLYVNGMKIGGFPPFSPKIAKAEHFKLVLNEVDIRQLLKCNPSSIQKPIQKVYRDIYKKIPENERLKYFVELLRSLSQNTSKLSPIKVGNETHFKWPKGRDVSTNDMKLNLSRVRCLTNYNGSMEEKTLKSFEGALKGFTQLFDIFYKFEKRHIIKRPTAIVWANGAVNENDYVNYMNNSRGFTSTNTYDIYTLSDGIILVMDESALPDNNNVLSLYVGTLGRWVKDLSFTSRFTSRPSYQLEFFSDD